MNQHFLSDNASPAHPAVLQAVLNANQGYEPAYGEDSTTQKAKQLIKEHFNSVHGVLFVNTGTASNIIALKSVLEPYEAIICADKAHLNRDECGAPEAILGCKLISLPTLDGKIRPEDISDQLIDSNMVHRAQPRVVSISQCTEWGTVYTLEELQAISACCKKNKLLLHIDGARLSNAACALNTTLHQLCLEGQVDLVSLGGTKNGLMGAEAILFFNHKVSKKAAFLQKQCMQLTSKMRYVSSQFIAFFENNLWYQNASHANKMGQLLAELVSDVVEIVMPVESNVVFAKIPEPIILPLQEKYPFAVWDSKNHIVRWMTSYDTKEETVRDFAHHITKAIS